MADQEREGPEARPSGPARDEADDAGRGEHEGAEPGQGEGRMSGARTGRHGGAHEDQGGPPSGFTPEGRSGT